MEMFLMHGELISRWSVSGLAVVVKEQYINALTERKANVMQVERRELVCRGKSTRAELTKDSVTARNRV